MKTPTIRTRTGKSINLLKPDPALIDIRDIAHALAHLCRFCGHTTQFYSVAQHSVLVSMRCDDPMQGLLHDAPEAYLGDVSSPLKRLLPGYVELEDHWWEVIAKKFGVSPTMSPSVKSADRTILADEQRAFMGLPQKVGFDININPAPPEIARHLFLVRYRELLK